MPLPMVHLITACNLQSEKINKSPEFYLGTIAPDSVHMRENYKREYKTASHFAVKNVGTAENLQSLIDMIKESKSQGERDFLSGVLVHCLTDKYWLDTLYIDVFTKRYEADESPLQNNREAYYNDTDRLDFELYEKFPEREMLWRYLADAKAYDVEDRIRKEEAYKWRDRTLGWFSKESEHKNPIKYIKYEDITEFISQAAEKIDVFLLNNL